MEPEDYTAPDGAPWPTCWACLRPFRDGRVGVSLDDTGEPSVCRHCWLKIPLPARVAFKIVGPTAAWLQWAISSITNGEDDAADWWKKNFFGRGNN